jgi:hypothetical protein
MAGKVAKESNGISIKPMKKKGPVIKFCQNSSSVPVVKIKYLHGVGMLLMFAITVEGGPRN